MLGLTQDRVTRIDVKRDSYRGTATSATDRTAGGADRNGGSGTLARTVELEVIPRLLVAHCPGAEPLPLRERLLGRSDVVELAGLLAACDIASARQRIEAKRAQGVSLESMYLNLLIPAACRLSDLWEADLCHFEEIAVGLMHLQRMLHEHSVEFCEEAHAASQTGKALLISAPCEQSMLGVFMVSEFCRGVTTEFFHRAGWEVWHSPPASRAHLLELVRARWFDVIDISATCEGRLSDLAEDIAAIRKHSRNRTVGVTVGGPVFFEASGANSLTGADACAGDARRTLQQAEYLVARRVQESAETYY